VLAVLAATREARRRAAAGEGPTLVELVTYRMGAHTNSDDPTRYVPEAELAEWRARDPIERYRAELRRSGLWDDERHDAAMAEVEVRLEGIIERALAREVDPASALDHVDGVPSARNRAQRADIVARSTPASPDSPATVTPAPRDDAAESDDTEPPDSATGGVSWRA
jgi:TPP-dependent pyruvate/acetoin dehydrogenase alpha subunit